MHICQSWKAGGRSMACERILSSGAQQIRRGSGKPVVSLHCLSLQALSCHAANPCPWVDRRQRIPSDLRSQLHIMALPEIQVFLW